MSKDYDMDGETESTQPAGCPGRSSDLVATAVLWGLWVLSVVPLVVLFIEFHGRSEAVCSLGAGHYAKLYGHFFVYPIVFGLPATVLLTRPWLHTVGLIRHLPTPKRRRVVAFLAVSILGIVSFASWADFTKATPALWSFKATVQPEAAKEENAVKVIVSACSTLVAKSQMAEDTDSQTRAQTQQNGEEKRPLDVLKPLLGKEALSLTERAYYIGFIGNTTWVALLFGVVVVRTGLGDRTLLGQLVVAVALATAWVPLRAAFLVEKTALYTDELLPMNYLIFLAFVVLYLHILRLYAPRLGDRGRQITLWTGNLIVIGLSLLSTLAGSVAGSDLDWSGSGGALLVDYFGSKSSVLKYIGMLMLLLVMVAPAAVRRLWDGSGDETTTGPDVGGHDAGTRQSGAE